MVLIVLWAAAAVWLPWAAAYGPAFLQTPPAEVLYSNNTGLILDCLARGDPPPIIDWVDANGNVLSIHPSVASQLHNGSLYLLPFTQDPNGLFFHQFNGGSSGSRGSLHHESRFRCRATNAYGKIVSTVVSVKPVLTDFLPVRVQGEPVLKFNTAVLRCQVPQSTASYTKIVSWTRGSSRIYPSSRGDGKYHVLPSGDLHIFRAEEMEAEVAYSCRVLNTLTNVEESSPPFHLAVDNTGLPAKPRELMHQDLYYSFEKDETGVLACNVQSNPPPAFSWFRVRNNLLEPVARTSRIFLSGSVLVIDSLREDDGGQYRCTARNEGGEVSLTMNLDIASPISVDVVPSEQIIDIGRQARLECLTEDRDRSAITWMKDGQALPNHPRFVANRQTLQIFNLQTDDYGMYQCFVARGHQEAQASSELRLGDASPIMTYRFIDQTMQPGPLVSLKCAARGSPTPKIHWELNGRDLPQTSQLLVGQYVTVHGEVVSHVNISQVSVQDGGLYQCQASNRAGSAAHSARLNIYGPPHVHPLGELRAVVGKEFSVVCPVSGYPIDKITWTKEGRSLPMERRHQVLENGTLIINKVTRKDKGLYSCTATNRQGNSASQSGQLKVIVPPTINKFTVGEHLRLGQRVSMLCSVTDGDLPLTLKWYRHDQLLLPEAQAAGGISVTDIGQYESVLRIDNLKPEHNANFTCVAENYAGISQHSQVLRVKVSPLVERFSFPKNLTRGKRLRVICTVTEGDLPLEVEWWKDGLKIEEAFGKFGVQVRRIDEYTSLLAISFLETTHAGNYSCVAKNSVASFARYATLTIRVPPEWIVKPQDQEAVEGQDVFFDCRVSGVPEPSIIWRRLADQSAVGGSNAHPVLELNQQRPVFRNYRLLMNGTLFISKASENDEGKFICEADNGVNEPIGKMVTLKINAPPKFDVAHAGPVTGRTGETLELVCEAAGDDHINIKWGKNGQDYLTLPGKSSTTEIRELERVTSKLRIGDATSTDAGRYSCQASNAFGTSHFSIDVTIWEPPPTPQNLSILDIQSRSVKVAWSVERASPGVDRLVVQWKEQSEDWYPQGKQNILPGQMTETLVTNLRPWTVYHLRVFAENQLGKSKDGKVLQFVTDGEKPGGPPRNVRITGLASTSLEVTWDDPEQRLLHGIITRYNLGYREYNSPNYRFVDVDKLESPGNSGSRFIIRRLRKYTKYEIVVQAVNTFGEGPLSIPSIGQTQEDAPEGPPEKVHCVSLTSTTIQVSWHPPQAHVRNGIIKGYKVLHAPRPGQIPTPAYGTGGAPKTTRLSTVTTVLDNLQKFTNYSIQVLAFTQGGDGKYSFPVSCITLTDVPGAPKAIKAVVKSPRSVVVSWLPPNPSNGMVDRYHIYLRRSHSSLIMERNGGHNKYTRPADVKWITIEDLEPDRQYQFWVTAVTSAGEGRSSDVISETPSSRVPAKITSISDVKYTPARSSLSLPCSFLGEPLPSAKWLYNNYDPGWMQRRTAYGQSNAYLEDVTRDRNNGNYTCVVENTLGTDSISYQVYVQEPPKAANVHVTQTTASSLTIRWRITDDGQSPVNRIAVNYKMTYGEWVNEDLGWFENEHVLRNLNCGREYHVYVVVFNSMGASPASQVLTTRTLGNRPTAPGDAYDFIVTNTTFLSLRLDQWDDHNCEILYFVIEYKMALVDNWITVTNDLQPQSRYSIRGLAPDTDYELKVTAHNHAGSTSMRYTTATLAENYSGAAHYGDSSDFNHVIKGIGLRSVLLILVSSLCLVLASIGVCICLRKKHPSHAPVGYGEIPKSCTMENRQNLIEHQLYATIQRKQPPVPPFTTDTPCARKGFTDSTVERFKRLNNGEMCPYVGDHRGEHRAAKPENGILASTNTRCATLGRMKNLEMTEYQRQQKFYNGAHNIDSKEYTLSLGRHHKLRRKPYSESEDYDTDTSGDTRNEVLSRTHALHAGTNNPNAATVGNDPHIQEMKNRLNQYSALRYRQQFDL